VNLRRRVSEWRRYRRERRASRRLNRAGHRTNWDTVRRDRVEKDPNQKGDTGQGWGAF